MDDIGGVGQKKGKRADNEYGKGYDDDRNDIQEPVAQNILDGTPKVKCHHADFQATAIFSIRPSRR
jgi:hypothetical protein